MSATPIEIWWKPKDLIRAGRNVKPGRGYYIKIVKVDMEAERWTQTLRDALVRFSGLTIVGSRAILSIEADAVDDPPFLDCTEAELIAFLEWRMNRGGD